MVLPAAMIEIICKAHTFILNYQLLTLNYLLHTSRQAQGGSHQDPQIVPVNRIKLTQG